MGDYGGGEEGGGDPYGGGCASHQCFMQWRRPCPCAHAGFGANPRGEIRPFCSAVNQSWELEQASTAGIAWLAYSDWAGAAHGASATPWLRGVSIREGRETASG
jgi:hypothetical protein